MREPELEYLKRFYEDALKLDWFFPFHKIVELQVKKGFGDPYEILHEIGHFAIMPDWVLVNQKFRRPGEYYPSVLDSIMSNTGYGEMVSNSDITHAFNPASCRACEWLPGEWGCRAWCFEVIKYHGWEFPTHLVKPGSEKWVSAVRNEDTWEENGYKQLEDWGIKPPRFRPVEFCDILTRL